VSKLFPPSRRTYGAYRDEEAARDGAYNLARLLNGVPLGYVIYTQPRMGAWVVCDCAVEEMATWKAAALSPPQATGSEK
jgi:hypothetical protein